jgi:hypothetical protein
MCETEFSPSSVDYSRDVGVNYTCGKEVEVTTTINTPCILYNYRANLSICKDIAKLIFMVFMILREYIMYCEIMEISKKASRGDVETNEVKKWEWTLIMRTGYARTHPVPTTL